MQEALTLESFVDKLIVEKGLSNLEPDVLEQVKKDLIVRAEQRINAEIIAALPPEKLEEFEQMLSKGAGDEEKQLFLSQHISDMPTIVASALMQFRNTYLIGA
ncbi:MAG: hypothetical protein ACD_76C00073G0004 [uncultured bacterium]|nr:MAG: hypothetical protein ACD_76C00073G0004 [uncultured bacterium]HBD04838.1 hypothetical protein [Candidatus Uhrbacteria bacterium]